MCGEHRHTALFSATYLETVHLYEVDYNFYNSYQSMLCDFYRYVKSAVIFAACDYLLSPATPTANCYRKSLTLIAFLDQQLFRLLCIIDPSEHLPDVIVVRILNSADQRREI